MRNADGCLAHVCSARCAGAALVAVLALALLSAGAAAGEASLTLRIRSLAATARGDAPLPIQVDLIATGTAVRTGRLELRVVDGRQPLLHWTSDEWTVAAGTRSAAVLLPPLALDRGHDAIVGQAVWHERGGTFPLGDHTLAAADRGGHDLVLAFCPPTVSAQAAGHLTRVLALDGVARPDDLDGARLRIASLRLSGDQLPRQALAWCAYDAALIAGDSLAGLADEQLAALERWVLAGGSCALAIDGALPPRVAALITRCAGAAAAAEAAADFAEHRRWRAGLGRLVLAPMADSDEKRWAQSAAWVWGLRDHPAQLLATDRSGFASAAAAAMRSNPNHHEQRGIALLTGLLLPEQITIIPLPIILGVFLLFVLAIGPGDWLLLGALRARRFTWLLFPALAVGCTLFMVWLSERYLGSRDQRQVLAIVDVAADGSVLRHDRISLLFTGSTRSVEDAPRQALWANLGEGQRDPRFQADSAAPGGPAHVTGTMPSAYRVERTVSQWTPTLHRELSFAPVELPLRVPWQRLTDLPATTAQSDADALLRELGAEAAVLFDREGGSRTFGALPKGRESSAQVVRYPHQESAAPTAWLYALTWNNVGDSWGSLISRHAPRGGATLADCAIASDDTGERVAVVIARRGEVLWVIRCLIPSATRRR